MPRVLGIVHALQEHEFAHSQTRAWATIERDRRRKRAADNDGVGIGLLDPVIARAQKACIRLRIYWLFAPLGVDVGLIPQLIVAQAPGVSGRYGVDEIAPVIVIVRWSVGAPNITVVRRVQAGGLLKRARISTSYSLAKATMWSYFSHAERLGSWRRSSKSPLPWISMSSHGNS